jgi:eukaryotic-like serine/threonine-protein kinase
MTTPRLLSNRYELGETLGYGGMSEVHRGRDVRLGRDVAVKVLRADLARDPQFQERFRREAQNAAALNHPAIVAIYDTGETRTEHGPLPYIVMECVEGRTLRDIVKTEGPLSGQRAMEIMADVCAALDFSHRHGIVHRDVKPANVMITKTGAVKVMDFGIARAVADGQAAVTQTAAVIGTAQYLSPEQARGEAVDARSDVYAAGCVLFELLTGEPPFTGDSPVAVAYQHVREDPRPPSQVNSRVSPALDAVVLKAMAKGAANRYQSAAEMRTDLVRVLSGQRPMAPMVMTDEDRTTIMAAGRRQDQRTGRHRPAAVADDYDDEDYDAEEEERRRRKKAWTIALVALLALALIALVAWLATTVFNREDPGSDRAEVPNVVGQQEGEAVRSLNAQGFNPRPDYVPCEPGPNGQAGPCGPDKVGIVLSTKPGAGAMMNKSDPLILRVGAPATKVAVPNLTGKTVEEAKQLLAGVGLVLDQETPYVDTADENMVDKVVEQTPQPDQQVGKGSTVKISLGKAEEKISVVDVTGQPFDQAKSNLEGLGFTVTRTDVSSDKPAGTVVDQNPKSGKYPANTEIVLSVSKGDQDQIEMPDITGMNVDQAERELRELGWTGTFNIVEEPVDNPLQDGEVLEQEVAEGQKISKGQSVGIVVGKRQIG